MAWDSQTQEETLTNSDPVIMETRSIATLLQLGNTLLEAELLLPCKHAFPNVPQKLFPSTCLDGVYEIMNNLMCLNIKMRYNLVS